MSLRVQGSDGPGDEMHEALVSRNVIGQAEGIRAECFHFDAEQVVRLLIRRS